MTAAVAAAVVAFAALPAAADSYPVAVLRGLDKVTARVSTIQAPVGESVQFGKLEVVARTCDKPPPEERPEAAAFLDIKEIRPEQGPRKLYSGWMFASSPALAAMDHPVYDIWVLDCASTVSSDASSSSDSASQ